MLSKEKQNIWVVNTKGKYLSPDEIKQTLASHGIDYDSIQEKQMRDHELLRRQVH